MSNPGLNEQLLARLRTGTASSPELEALLRQSQSAVSRRLRDLLAQEQVIRIGSRRGARYGLLRHIEGIGAQWPLRRIDELGNVHLLGVLSALAADEYHFQNAPNIAFAWPGVTHGLPYFLQDQRPGGFLGRAVPQRYPELHLPQRVVDWNDDHYLRYLTQRGSDTVSDLILGDAAFNGYLASQRPRTSVRADQREPRFHSLAAEVMEGGLPGSSAHGEHPKFAVSIEVQSSLQQVIVKFSPTIDTPIGQRWSDLLVTEHLAHQVLTEAGIASAQSRIEQFAGRTYLEVGRFDRAGVDGRVGATSLLAIDTHLYGNLDNWLASATRLHRDRRIDSLALETVRLAATFGAMIANTDRHFGNLAFFDRYDGQFILAPIYDMLPMLFAPEHGQVTERVFIPPDPTADTLPAYARSRAMAEIFWRRAAEDLRISAGFRDICSRCGAALEALPRTGAYAYIESQ